MTDEPGLTPEQEAEVSRFLAQEAGPVTTPPEVLDRLDGVLAGLVAERTPRPVRPRRWPQVLLAAAAVVLAGYGVGTLVDSGTVGDDSDGAAESSVAGDSGDGGGGVGGVASEAAGKRQLVDSLALADAPIRLRSNRLEADVARVLRLPPSTLAPDEADRAEKRTATAGSCVPPVLGRGATWYVVRFDGRPATLVTGPERAGEVPARVWSCAGDQLADASVPAP